MRFRHRPKGAVFDADGGEFVEPGASLAERVFCADRYMDLHQRSEASGLTYVTTTYQASGTAESA